MDRYGFVFKNDSKTPAYTFQKSVRLKCMKSVMSVFI